MIARDRLLKARRQIKAIPDPKKAARHAQELQWAARLVTATPQAREKAVAWQAKALGMEPKEWRRHRKAVEPGSTFAGILAVLDEMSNPDFEDSAFDALETMFI